MDKKSLNNRVNSLPSREIAGPGDFIGRKSKEQEF